MYQYNKDQAEIEVREALRVIKVDRVLTFVSRSFLR